VTQWAALVAMGVATLAGAAIGHATAGPGARPAGPAIVTVGSAPGGVATGFVAGAGRVVTVAHVLRPGGATAVRGADGLAHRATVLRRDDALDLAVLAVPGLRPSWMPRSRSGTQVLVRRGATVQALPARVVRRIDATVRTAGVPGPAAHRPALELAASPAAGDSGAPVLQDGRIAGVVFARSSARAGVAYAVDASVLEGLLP
jgi:S1-C subfamily serine protease